MNNVRTACDAIRPPALGYASGMTKQILESIDVDGPVNMEGVERIDQITDTKTRWVTKIAGVER